MYALVDKAAAIYLDSGQQAVKDTHSQRKSFWTELKQPVHFSNPNDHLLVLGQGDVSTLPDKERTSIDH